MHDLLIVTVLSGHGSYNVGLNRATKSIALD